MTLMEDGEMKKVINRKVFNTDTATELGYKYFGDFGSPFGYEERLFITKSGQHFIYGIGGYESVHCAPNIKLITPDEAKVWESYI